MCHTCGSSVFTREQVLANILKRVGAAEHYLRRLARALGCLDVRMFDAQFTHFVQDTQVGDVFVIYDHGFKVIEDVLLVLFLLCFALSHLLHLIKVHVLFIIAFRFGLGTTTTFQGLHKAEVIYRLTRPADLAVGHTALVLMTSSNYLSAYFTGSQDGA